MTMGLTKEGADANDITEEACRFSFLQLAFSFEFVVVDAPAR